MQRDGLLVGVELEAYRLGLDHLEREVAGLELGSGYSPVHAGTRQAQQRAVELQCRREVPGGHRDEVDAGDDGCLSGHSGSSVVVRRIVMASVGTSSNLC